MQWPELLLIDKPEGISSFDVIRWLRKQYTTEYGEKAPKMGHAGTLDPLATGLMLIGVGPGTKKLTDYIKLDKEYVTEVIIGRSTTTGDREGDILEETPIPLTSSSTDLELVAGAVPGLVGTHRLPVSAFSAIKKDGVPMYKRAREADKIGDLVTDVPYRDMTVHEAELLDVTRRDDYLIATIRFSVASGVYIRSLGEELGRRLGYPASLSSLRRTKVGKFDIKNAQSLG